MFWFEVMKALYFFFFFANYGVSEVWYFLHSLFIKKNKFLFLFSNRGKKKVETIACFGKSIELLLSFLVRLSAKSKCRNGHLQVRLRGPCSEEGSRLAGERVSASLCACVRKWRLKHARLGATAARFGTCANGPCVSIRPLSHSSS